ncbi:GGDEF domain-containing protein [Rhodanobacter sp. AS-Z3]|uniref:GGDEF domain-containing protein n=1 Tax=Rhodanobacter sp. AS-Z3 TaxID=3031330 RepID=UPI002479F4B8|nr:GGDEF domain-containing protein [Rhodanobacter sp. AS-Z3]WEN15672.1 GGDEF domain-containing protein [Rhodanobacter sp. AS-Z3]
MLDTKAGDEQKAKAMAFSNYSDHPEFLRTLTQGYVVLILVFVGLLPSLAIAYLYFFQIPPLRFEDHGAHEIAIGISLLQSGFIAYVTYRCYLRTKESFLQWLTLGFLGFTVIYGVHGLFTGFSHDHPMLFTLYGPASRLVMAGCLLSGLLAYGKQAPPTLQARPGYFWWAWLGVFALIDVLVAPLAFSAWAKLAQQAMEIAAMGIMLSCALIILVRRIRSPLMMVYVLSVVFFAQSSFAFLLGPSWNHMWWLAHAIFAAGFTALSYGVIHAFLTTGSFARVYSQTELLDQVRAEKARTDDALLELQRAHEALEILATTDALTGCANRRSFEARSVEEISRVKRSAAPLSFVTIDLDLFKQINDGHGHAAGDQVLKDFVTLAKSILRPSDLMGRIGGEEFALMLTDTPLEAATMVAERLRQITENEVVSFSGTCIRFTASLGVAQYGLDGDTYEATIEAADKRMYHAKQAGRNQVCAR